LTSEQLEAARAERLRQNGLGTLTLEDARTWIEETGLCLFLPRRQFSSSVAPSFVEAIAGKRDETPDPRQIAAAEELLVRLELQDVAVRLNLQGQPGEHPDFVVASWVLPYVYALRGDRDWRRSPQLTGSRAVSQLAVQAYKLLETGDQTISQLKQGLGREVSESAVVRAITELWQQLRIVPVIAAPGQPAKWQLLKHRFQKAIAEGASTSQVTAISVLASIYLQAVIAASMEDVELFLSPLTARSKVREVLRGLVATRQVHTISLGHSPHFYVAGTLPEFPAANVLFGGSLSTPGYYYSNFDREEHVSELPMARPVVPPVAPAPAPAAHVREARPEEPKAESHAPRTPVRKPAAAGKAAGARPHSRPAPHVRDRKPGTSRPGTASSSGSRSTTRHGSDSRSASASGTSRWGKSANGKSNGNHASKAGSNGTRTSATGGRTASSSARNEKSSAPTWAKSNGHAKNGKPAGKPAASGHKSGLSRSAASGSRKPALAAGAKAGNSKRYGFTARPKPGAKKRG
jgi:23S rRNA pseudouridine2605 synthase